MIVPRMLLDSLRRRAAKPSFENLVLSCSIEARSLPVVLLHSLEIMRQASMDVVAYLRKYKTCSIESVAESEITWYDG